MGITDLLATNAMLTTSNEDDFSAKALARLGVANANEVFLEQSRLELKFDLAMIQGINIDDTDKLDNLVANNTEYLQKALAYKQLSYFYHSRLNGDEYSIDNIKYNEYSKKYDDLKKRFNTLGRKTLTYTTTTSLRR